MWGKLAKKPGLFYLWIAAKSLSFIQIASTPLTTGSSELTTMTPPAHGSLNWASSRSPSRPSAASAFTMMTKRFVKVVNIVNGLWPTRSCAERLSTLQTREAIAELTRRVTFLTHPGLLLRFWFPKPISLSPWAIARDPDIDKDQETTRWAWPACSSNEGAYGVASLSSSSFSRRATILTTLPFLHGASLPLAAPELGT